MNSSDRDTNKAIKAQRKIVSGAHSNFRVVE